MKYFLIIITFLIALFGLLKPKKPARWFTTILIVFLLILLISQVAIEIRSEAEKEKQKTAGKLITNSKTILSSKTNTFPKLEFGNSGSILVYAGDSNEPAFIIFDDNQLYIKTENGEVKISTIIRDKNGNIVAEIIDNEWRINRNNYYDRNYSKNALEIKDNTGDIVLQIKLVEDRVQIQTKMYDRNGKGFAMVESTNPSYPGGIFEMTNPKKPYLTSKIKPIFKYPSELHLGVLIDD